MAEADPNRLWTDTKLSRDRFACKVRHVRAYVGLTQVAFAAAIGVPVPTLRDWEQGKVEPDAAARVLIKLLAHDPYYVLRVLTEGHTP